MIDQSRANRGSEWRIWDLHVHSPASGFGTESDYPQFIKNLKDSEAEVIGINDYASVDGYTKVMEMGGVDGKVIFPVTELRMDNKINHKRSTATKGGESINFHLIFDNELKPQQIKDALGSLSCYDENGDDTILSHISDKKHLEKVSFSFKHVISKLNTLSSIKGRFLVWVPYDEYGGIDNIDPDHDSFFKMAILKKTNILGSANQKQIDFFLSDKCKNVVGKTIPCIKGSDSHKIDYPFGRLKNEKSEPIAKYCWIKAEPTFEGLRQICLEPEQRVKIQRDKPDFKEGKVVIDFVKFTSSHNTFAEHPIYLSPNLNVIIGGKSSGKSILLYSIARTLSADEQILLKEDESFKYDLTKIDEGFDFEVMTQGETRQRLKREEGENSILPDIKYIPQNYLVKLAEPELTKSGGKLNKIVRDLINEDIISKQHYDGFIETIKQNDRMREQKIESYFILREDIKQLESELATKSNTEVLSKNIAFNEREVEELNKKVGLTAEQIAEYKHLQRELDIIKKRENDTKRGIQQINRFNSDIRYSINEIKKKKQSLLQEIEIVELQKFVESRYALIDKLHEELIAIEKLSQDTSNLNQTAPYTEGSLFHELTIQVQNNKDSLLKKLEPFQRDEETKEKIHRLNQSIDEDRKTIQQIKSFKERVESKKQELTKLEEQILNDFKENYQEYGKVLDALKVRTSELEKDGLKISGKALYNFKKLRENLLPLSDGRSASFKDFDLLDSARKSTENYESDYIFEEVRKLFLAVINNTYKLSKKTTAKEAVKIILDDYFFDYWEIVYKNDRLGEMSTGKASFVILMLIVGLSRSKAPILIDQPEDNLDNRSITSDLVSYLRNKKLERQIILVTHNANVVVNADAENVIVANQKGQGEQDYSSEYRFDYINGAIENSFDKKIGEPDLLKSTGIRQHVADVVEGGKDAFLLREKKYGFSN